METRGGGLAPLKPDISLEIRLVQGASPAIWGVFRAKVDGFVLETQLVNLTIVS